MTNRKTRRLQLRRNRLYLALKTKLAAPSIRMPEPMRDPAVLGAIGDDAIDFLYGHSKLAPLGAGLMVPERPHRSAAAMALLHSLHCAKHDAAMTQAFADGIQSGTGWVSTGIGWVSVGVDPGSDSGDQSVFARFVPAEERELRLELQDFGVLHPAMPHPWSPGDLPVADRRLAC